VWRKFTVEASSDDELGDARNLKEVGPTFKRESQASWRKNSIGNLTMYKNFSSIPLGKSSLKYNSPMPLFIESKKLLVQASS